MSFDRRIIKIKSNNVNNVNNKNVNNKNVNNKNLNKDVNKDDKDKKNFSHIIYDKWNNDYNLVEMPNLLNDTEKLSNNKDVKIIPRMFKDYYINKNKRRFPFVFINETNKYKSLNKYFRNYFNKDIPSITDFTQLLIEKRDIDNNQDLFESFNLFLYSSFVLKQFAHVMGIIEFIYTPISDETKYYFFILFDYLRRKSINEYTPLIKSKIVSLVTDLYSLNNKIITKELFLNTFKFIDENIFTENGFYLPNEDGIFNFYFVKN
jgi:hypothetical protein